MSEHEIDSEQSVEEEAKDKEWLFQENIRLSQQRRELEEAQAELERQKTEFHRKQDAENARNRLERRKLEQEKRLFKMKWQVLEDEVRRLEEDKRRVQQERAAYQEVRSQKHTSEQQYDMFFAGVHNRLSLKKRYKDLIKIFHPDNLAGDKVTLQEINREYDTLKQILL